MREKGHCGEGPQITVWVETEDICDECRDRLETRILEAADAVIAAFVQEEGLDITRRQDVVKRAGEGASTLVLPPDRKVH